MSFAMTLVLTGTGCSVSYILQSSTPRTAILPPLLQEGVDSDSDADVRVS